MTLGPLLQAAALSRSLAQIAKSKTNHFYAPSKSNFLALAALVQSSSKPIAIITSSSRQSQEISDALVQMVDEIEVIDFPSWETLPHERLSPSAETVGKRLQALHRMNQFSANNPKHKVVVMISIRAALQPVIGGLEDHPPFEMTRGKDYLLPELALKLIEIAYERVDMVTRRGEFAIRGGILDVFPTTAEHAVRLEFFGDELEDIREFQVADQRSIAVSLSAIELYPAREMLITPAVASKAREMASEFPGLSEMLTKISEGIPAAGMESLAPVLAKKLGPLTQYLPTATFVLLDPELISSRAKALADTNEEFLHAAWDTAIAGGSAPIDLSTGGFL
ncbi:MAG: transcription-repair coupling factor, partial [Aquiluna sp.]